MTEPLVSIVIPVLRDSVKLERLLNVLDQQRREVGFDSDQYEVIVSNGDETDLSVAALKRKCTSKIQYNGLIIPYSRLKCL